MGLLQLQVDSADGVDQRIDRAMSLVEKILAGANVELSVVAAEGTDLSASVEFLVLPELWTVGALDSEAMLAAPLSIDGSVVKAFAELAAKYSVWLHLGSIPEVDGDQRFNTSIVFGPDGVIAATYRKIHLFGFDSGEAAMLTSGTQIVCVPTAIGATGLSTCYDVRFPELYRQQLDAGAESFVIPAGWPLARIEHWRTLLKSRSIENLAWTLGCNQVGTQAGVVLGGASAVVNPWGEVLIEAPADQECLVLADVDVELVHATRSRFPVLRDRKL